MRSTLNKCFAGFRERRRKRVEGNHLRKLAELHRPYKKGARWAPLFLQRVHRA